MVEPLFQNHLDFMAAHRGSVRYSDGDVHIEGPIEELVSFVPGRDTSTIPAARPAVRLAPWSGPGWPQRLAAVGYTHAMSLRYMELADAWQPLAAAEPADIRLAASESDALAFARIQSAGFATGDRTVDDWWDTYLPGRALHNYTAADQSFYLACVDGRPASITLVVRSMGMSGVYAVVTLPAQRRCGLAAAVLERVRRDAVANGHARVILQAVCGSYADAYYAKLGFLTRYESALWRRNR